MCSAGNSKLYSSVYPQLYNLAKGKFKQMLQLHLLNQEERIGRGIINHCNEVEQLSIYADPKIDFFCLFLTQPSDQHLHSCSRSGSVRFSKPYQRSGRQSTCPVRSSSLFFETGSFLHLPTAIGWHKSQVLYAKPSSPCQWF